MGSALARCRPSPPLGLDKLIARLPWWELPLTAEDQLLSGFCHGLLSCFRWLGSGTDAERLAGVLYLEAILMLLQCSKLSECACEPRLAHLYSLPASQLVSLFGGVVPNKDSSCCTAS